MYCMVHLAWVRRNIGHGPYWIRFCNSGKYVGIGPVQVLHLITELAEELQRSLPFANGVEQLSIIGQPASCIPEEKGKETAEGGDKKPFHHFLTSLTTPSIGGHLPNLRFSKQKIVHCIVIWY